MKIIGHFVMALIIAPGFFRCGSGRVMVSDDPIGMKGSSVAIVGFDMRERRNKTPLPRMGEEFSTALAPSFAGVGFSVIERDKIDLILRKLDLRETGVMDAKLAVRVGKIANARFVVFGNGLVSVSAPGLADYPDIGWVRMVNVENGEIINSVTWSGVLMPPAEAAAYVGARITEKFRYPPMGERPPGSVEATESKWPVRLR